MSGKNGSHYRKNGSHVEKWVTLGKIGHTWKNASHLEKCFTLGKMGHNWKNGLHMEKWVVLAKMRQSQYDSQIYHCPLNTVLSVEKFKINCKKKKTKQTFTKLNYYASRCFSTSNDS